MFELRMKNVLLLLPFGLMGCGDVEKTYEIIVEEFDLDRDGDGFTQFQGDCNDNDVVILLTTIVTLKSTNPMQLMHLPFTEMPMRMVFPPLNCLSRAVSLS